MGEQLMKKIIFITALVGLLTTGCSNGPGTAVNGGSFSTAQSESSGGTASNVINMAKVQQASSDANIAITNAQSALALITNANGSFKWTIIFNSSSLAAAAAAANATASTSSTPTASTQMEAQFITDGLAADLTTVLNLVVTKVQLAKTDIANARAAIAVQLAAAPAGSAVAVQLQDIEAQIDTVEAQYVSLVHSLASQISLVTTAMNSLSGLANTFCPIPIVCGVAVYILITPIEQAILAFQAKLMTI
jgi:hypothetical protein